MTLVHHRADRRVEIGRRHQEDLRERRAHRPDRHRHHGQAQQTEHGGVDVGRQMRIGRRPERPSEDESHHQRSGGERRHEPALRIEVQELRVGRAVRALLVEVHPEARDRHDQRVADRPAQLDLLASRQEAADRTHEAVHAQHHQHAAVERQAHGLDVPVAVLERAVLLASDQPGDPEREQPHRDIDDREQAVEDDRHRA